MPIPRSLAAAAALGALAGLAYAGLTLAGSNVDDPVLLNVSLARDADGVCRGEGHWVVTPKDADLKKSVGGRQMGLRLEVPCSALDALASFFPAVDTKGKASVVVRSVLVYLDGDGTCKAQMSRTVEALDAEVARVVGGRVQSENPAPVPCAKIPGAIAEAVIIPIMASGPDGELVPTFDWPVDDIALPYPVKK